MRPIAEVAGDRIVRVYRRMLKWGGAITPSSPPADYHELRKQGKELRYLLELFGAPLFDPAIVSPMVRALRGLQDTLGRHQDREVQVATLRRLAGEVASLPDGPNAVLAMGALVERLHSEEVAARAEFSERFARFSSKRTRKPALREFGRPR
jgi:CHAD domain-containing protein